MKGPDNWLMKLQTIETQSSDFAKVSDTLPQSNKHN